MGLNSSEITNWAPEYGLLEKMNNSSKTKKNNDILIMALVISYINIQYYRSYDQVFYINNKCQSGAPIKKRSARHLERNIIG